MQQTIHGGASLDVHLVSQQLAFHDQTRLQHLVETHRLLLKDRHPAFVSEDEAISKGVLDSGKPFWHWTIGDINGPAGIVYDESRCDYNDAKSNYPGWFMFDEKNMRFCSKLAARAPMLVDREPQEVIFILP